MSKEAIVSKEILDDGFSELRKTVKAEIMEFDEHGNCESRFTVLQVSDRSDDGYVELYDEDARDYTRFNLHALDRALDRAVFELKLPRTGRFSSAHPDPEGQKEEVDGPLLLLQGAERGYRIAIAVDERRVSCRMTRRAAQVIVDALDYLRYMADDIDQTRADEIKRTTDVAALKALGDQLTDAMHPRKAQS